MPESPVFPFDVFLSHNAQDKPRVRRLAERLKQEGVRVWLDEWVIQAGDIIALKVDEGLEQSRVLLLCISPAALASGWVALERSTAVHRDPANAGRRFIPLLLGDCALPDTLRRYKYVDFREESERAFAEVLATCRPEKEAVPLPEARKRLINKKSKAKLPKETEQVAVLERKFDGHEDWINSVAISPDGKWAVSGSGGPTKGNTAVNIWDMETGDCLATLKGHTNQVRSVAITPDGNRILSASFDKSVRVWDAKSGQELAKLDGHKVVANSVNALQDNVHALSSGGGDGTLKIWNLVTNLCVKTIECGTNQGDTIFSSAVNRSGDQALTGHEDGRVRLWSLDSGECKATLKGHTGIVHSVQVLRDGRFAVSGSKDKTVKVWDLEAETCLGTLEGHHDSVFSVAISPDATMIASTEFTDETVRLWDWKSGVCLQVIRYDGNPSPISATFSPDSSRLVVGTVRPSLLCVYRLTGTRHKPCVATTRRYVNAKVVLLGEGTVGKTSLAHRLIEDQYVIQDRTHGMNVWRLDLSLPPDETVEREALLWDLAGQEDYRLIHQLFLDETALALLLINPQKEDPFVEAGDWLKALKTANGPEAKREVARLLIFSQIDVGGMKLGNAKIDRFREQHGFANWLATSAKSGENCSDRETGGEPSKLKQLIAESVPWNSLPWTSTPRLLAELKNAVMAMRDESDIRLLRFSELAQRLERAQPGEKFGESDLRTAVTLLANHGLARPLKFGDLVLLRPDLINGYAGAVIRAARRIPMRSAACWKRTFTDRTSTSPASSG